MKTINDILLQVAAEVATEMGYSKVEEGDHYAKDDDFWGNKIAGYADKNLKIGSVKYVPLNFVCDDEKRRKPKIVIDMYWGSPRLNIDAINKDFCCLTYKSDTGKFTEAQAFGEGGIDLLVKVRNRINELKNQL